MTGLRSESRGVVMMEFLVALLPVMLAFLGMVQFSFAAVAKLTLKHAAVLGVRAAVVVVEEAQDVPGAPEDIYGGLAAGGLEESEQSDAAQGAAGTQLGQAASATERATGALSSRLGSLLSVLDRSRTRIDQIRTAAYLPLLSVSPDAIDDGLGFLVGVVRGDLDPRDSVEASIGDAGIGRLLGAFVYNLGAVAVTFPEEPGSAEHRSEPYAAGEDVTVRLSYLFRCRVPLASLLMCDSGWALYTGSTWADWATWRDAAQLAEEAPRRAADVERWRARLSHVRDRIDARTRRVDAFRGLAAEFDQVESKTVQELLLMRPGARYLVMQAEATLPLQSARYYPRADAEGR